MAGAKRTRKQSFSRNLPSVGARLDFGQLPQRRTQGLPNAENSNSFATPAGQVPTFSTRMQQNELKLRVCGIVRSYKSLWKNANPVASKTDAATALKWDRVAARAGFSNQYCRKHFYSVRKSFKEKITRAQSQGYYEWQDIYNYVISEKRSMEDKALYLWTKLQWLGEELSKQTPQPIRRQTRNQVNGNEQAMPATPAEGSPPANLATSSFAHELEHNYARTPRTSTPATKVVRQPPVQKSTEAGIITSFDVIKEELDRDDELEYQLNGPPYEPYRLSQLGFNQPSSGNNVRAETAQEEQEDSTTIDSVAKKAIFDFLKKTACGMVDVMNYLDRSPDALVTAMRLHHLEIASSQ